jgi:hypothetical protein
MSHQRRPVNLVKDIPILISVTSVTLPVLYILITWIAWGSFLQTKAIKIKSETSSSNKIGEGLRTYFLVTDLNGLNPESLVTGKLQYQVNLKDGSCYSIIAEGTKSIYQTKWIKSAEEISCKK